jgi:hypothetical protein
MPINPVQSAITAAQTQAALETNQLNKTNNANNNGPKTGATVVKTAEPQDQVTISTTARQAAATQPQPQTQTQLQAQQAKPAVASGKDTDTTGQ